MKELPLARQDAADALSLIGGIGLAQKRETMAVFLPIETSAVDDRPADGRAMAADILCR